jgi:hypothetical protein
LEGGQPPILAVLSGQYGTFPLQTAFIKGKIVLKDPGG